MDGDRRCACARWNAINWSGRARARVREHARVPTCPNRLIELFQLLIERAMMAGCVPEQYACVCRLRQDVRHNVWRSIEDVKSNGAAMAMGAERIRNLCTEKKKLCGFEANTFATIHSRRNRCHDSRMTICTYTDGIQCSKRHRWSEVKWWVNRCRSVIVHKNIRGVQMHLLCAMFRGFFFFYVQMQSWWYVILSVFGDRNLRNPFRWPTPWMIRLTKSPWTTSTIVAHKSRIIRSAANITESGRVCTWMTKTMPKKSKGKTHRKS